MTTPTLNIEALRATQASIADKESAFEMSDWNRCIHGHARRVLKIKSDLMAPSYAQDPRVYVALGLTVAESQGLFLHVPGSATHRADAIARIDALIAHRQFLDPIRNAPLALPPAAKAEIDAIIEEASQPEPELVCA